MAETLRKSLPFGWHLILSAMLLLGLFLAIMPIPAFPALGRLSSRIPADALYRVIGVILVAAAMTHWVVFNLLRGVRSLFSLVEGTDTARENLWPPALLGLCEATMYPLALVTGHSDFIGLWLLLKVAGQWPRWGLREKDCEQKLDRGRRRFYHFLIGNALMIMSSLVTYGILKMVALR